MSVFPLLLYLSGQWIVKLVMVLNLTKLVLCAFLWGPAWSGKCESFPWPWITCYFFVSSLSEFLAGRLLVKRKKAYRWTCNNTIIFEKVHICVLVDPTNRISFDNLFAGIHFLSSFFLGKYWMRFWTNHLDQFCSEMKNHVQQLWTDRRLPYTLQWWCRTSSTS